VHELARPATCSGGKITALDQRDRQAATRGVERDSRTRHAAADDKDIHWSA
jgi:hypothetical protein